MRCFPSPRGTKSKPQYLFSSWVSAVPNLDLVLDSPVIYTQHLFPVTKKATAVLNNIFAHLRDSTLTQSCNLTIYKLLIRSILPYAAPVCSSICSSSYLTLQVAQTRCLPLIGNYPNSHLHDTLKTKPIPGIIHRLTDKFLLPPKTSAETNQELYSSRHD
jgi:hypothetical protein